MSGICYLPSKCLFFISNEKPRICYNRHLKAKLCQYALVRPRFWKYYKNDTFSGQSSVKGWANSLKFKSPEGVHRLKDVQSVQNCTVIWQFDCALRCNQWCRFFWILCCADHYLCPAQILIISFVWPLLISQPTNRNEGKTLLTKFRFKLQNFKCWDALWRHDTDHFVIYIALFTINTCEEKNCFQAVQLIYKSININTARTNRNRPIFYVL